MLEGLLSDPLTFWAGVTLLSLADSINPCMLAVMVALVSGVAALGRRKEEVVRLALLFTATVFLTYFSVGLLVYLGYGYASAVATAQGWYPLLKTILVAALVIGGIINIKDAFTDVGPSLKIPESARPTIKGLINAASAGAIVTLAAFVTLVELPCTGLFYLGLIAVLHNVFPDVISALPVLIYYNALFILPEVLITVAVWKGADAAFIKSLHRTHRDKMRVLEGIILITLGWLLWSFG